VWPLCQSIHILFLESLHFSFCSLRVRRTHSFKYTLLHANQQYYNTPCIVCNNESHTQYTKTKPQAPWLMYTKKPQDSNNKYSADLPTAAKTAGYTFLPHFTSQGAFTCSLSLEGLTKSERLTTFARSPSGHNTKQ
jgi:hypothetical protein